MALLKQWKKESLLIINWQFHNTSMVKFSYYYHYVFNKTTFPI